MNIQSIDVKGVLKEFHECAGTGIPGSRCKWQCTRFFNGNSKNLPTQRDQYFKLTPLVAFTIKVPTNTLYIVESTNVFVCRQSITCLLYCECADKDLNWPFYSCVLSVLALDWKRGWG